MSDLRCAGVRVDIEGHTILSGVDLEVPSGSVCALVGESGAGKTTLLRSIAGLASPVAGSIDVGGQSILGTRPERRRVGFVFQDPRLFPTQSVGENVAYARRVRGERRAPRLDAARAILTEVGLGDRMGASPSSLSGGEQQRVALARALSAEPALLLLDEPLSAVDGPRRDDLRTLLRRLQRDHPVTTVIVTHDLSDAAALAGQIAVLDDGAIVQCSPPGELFERPASPRVARLTGNPNRLRDGLTIRPEHLRIDSEDGTEMRVVDLEPRGTYARVHLDGPIGQLVAHVPSGRQLRPGDRVNVGLPFEHLWRFPDDRAIRPMAGRGA